MSRTVPSPKTREFARRLLIHEAAEPSSFRENAPAAFRVAEKLRHSLTTFAGAAGFHSLLARALALAKVHSHSLGTVYVKPDGSLEGLDELHANEAAEAGAMLIAQLIGLLFTFIGEQLTVHLVRDAWPDLPVNEISPEQNQHE